ncbi:hypothetical protein ACFFGH_32530 [Lysobacter korlensis]|uniref:Radical SAM core domain-containing protein n=1 Tax=Lysobacter korlensis TaxID=553636 RepID=A0ABV6S020_9GAMM
MAGRSPLFDRLCTAVPALVRRAPPPHDESRWHRATLGDHVRRFAQPITLTPYASARACSARCRFCSETLRPAHGGTMAARLRPGADYFALLRKALSQVRGIPMSWSLSGLEASDDEDWLLELLDTLAAEERDGGVIHDRVLYSNGAGLARARGDELVAALERFGLSWLELSRHDSEQHRNQAIMRFRIGEPIADQDVFARTAAAVATRVPVKLVCILQKDGVCDAAGLRAYLRWAAELGVQGVIVRDLSRLDDHYRSTTSRRYIDGARVSIESVLVDCMAAPWWDSLMPLRMTEGYYFWNLVARTPGGMEVTFEVSDYAAMHQRHQTGDVYKLVFHANGSLCAGWEPDRDVLWTAAS